MYEFDQPSETAAFDKNADKITISSCYDYQSTGDNYGFGSLATVKDGMTNVIKQAGKCDKKWCGFFDPVKVDGKETVAYLPAFVVYELAQRNNTKIRQQIAGIAATVLLPEAPQLALKVNRTIKLIFTTEKAAPQISEFVAPIKATVVERLKDASNFSLSYTDAELTSIVNSGKGLGLTDKEIEDMIYIGCREAKPISSGELINQMNNWASIVSKRGYPYKFTDLGQFNKFKDELKQGLSGIGISTNDVRIQGSALRTPNANDVDLAAIISESDFNDFLVERYNNRITKNGTKIELMRKTDAQLKEIAYDYAANPSAYTNQGKSFSKAMLERKISAYSKDDIISGARELYNKIKMNYPELNIENISIQTKGGSFDLKPYINL